METFLFILAAVAFFALYCILAAWGGKCPKCGSLNNWRDIRYNHDDHRPNLVFEISYTRCSKCKEEANHTSKEKLKTPQPRY